MVDSEMNILLGGLSGLPLRVDILEIWRKTSARGRSGSAPFLLRVDFLWQLKRQPSAARPVRV
jgi:hypothetical protein